MDTKKRRVLILGGDMSDQHTIGQMTRNRVVRGAIYDQENKGVEIYVAPGFSPDFPEMPLSLATLMEREFEHFGCHVHNIGPSATFDTIGELRAFMPHVREKDEIVMISASWHLRRVRKVIRKEWGTALARRVAYVSSGDPLTLRLFILESLKWVYLDIPTRFQTPLRRLFRILFGRSSW